MPRHNEEEIQLGIRLFQKICCRSGRTSITGGPAIWSGDVCQGGGFVTKHRMNEDSMTPSNVAKELKLKILKDATRAYHEEILKGVKKLLGEVQQTPPPHV